MSYGGVAKTLHWTVACLLVLQFPLAWTMPGVGRGQLPGSLVRLHLSIGLTVLAAMLLRLLWRILRPPPPLPDDVPRWQRHASAFVHWMLYAALLATPIAGWVWASTKGWRIALFGTIPVPRLPGVHSPLAPFAAAAHQFLAWTVLVLVGIHLLAVLYHSVLRHDDVAARMLPR